MQQVDKKDGNVEWTLVEAKLSSDLPKDLDKVATECHVVFNGADNIELTHPGANIGCASVKYGANGEVNVQGQSKNWKDDSKPGGGCGSSGGGRGLLQGCSASSGSDDSASGGDVGTSGADPNCKIRLVRGTDGRVRRRRVCIGG